MFEWLCLFVTFLPGCSDPVDLLNKRWPAVTVQEQHLEALRSADGQLSRMSQASIGAGISLADAASLLMNAPALTSNGIESLQLQGEGALVRVQAKFQREFTSADAPTDSNLAKVLAAVKPRVTGTVTVYAGLSATLSTQGPAPRLELKLLPAISRLELHDVQLAERWQATQVAQALLPSLERYKDNLSASLAALPLTRTSFPALSSTSLALDERLELSSSGTTAKLMVTAAPAQLVLRAGAVAWLIEKDRVSALAQLELGAQAASPKVGATAAPAQPGTASPASSAEASKAVAQALEQGYVQWRGRYLQRLQADLGLAQTPQQPWAALRKDFVAKTLNDYTRQAGACVAGDVQMPPQHIDHTIRLPNGLDINCTPTRECSAHSCSWNFTENTKNCSWPEKLVCEAEKAADNLGRRTIAAASQKACEANAIFLKGQCELTKEGEKRACEIGRAALNLLAIQEDFGRIKVDTLPQAKELKVCLKAFELAPSFESLAFTLEVVGSAQVRMALDYMPLNVLGHATCYKPWKAEKNFAVTLRQPLIASNVALALTEDGSDWFLQGSTAPTPIKVQLSPSPAEVLLQTPEMMLSCPLFTMVAPTVLALGPLVPPLAGAFDQTIEPQRFRVRLPLPQPELEGKSLVLRPALTSTALLVTTKL